MGVLKMQNTCGNCQGCFTYNDDTLSWCTKHNKKINEKDKSCESFESDYQDCLQCHYQINPSFQTNGLPYCEHCLGDIC